MLLRIPLPVALSLSVILHAAAVVSPLVAPPVAVPPAPTLELRLPQPEILPPAGPQAAPPEHLSTRPAKAAPAAAPRDNPPAMPRGRRLHEAQAELLKHLLYPPEAVAQGLEGEVILLLQLDEADRVTGAEVARSSGQPLLDRAAIDAARRIGRLPGHPRQSLLPVRFRLD